MALRIFNEVSYLPILLIRPGEMRALGELPDSTKNLMLPYIPLRPWLGSNHLEKSTDKIAEVYGKRPVIVGVGDRERFQDRPVFNQLEELRQPSGGFANWRDYIASPDNELFIPVVQLSPNPADEIVQIENFRDLARGMVFNVPRLAFAGVDALSQRVGALTAGGQDTIFILDWGVASNDHLQVAAYALNLIETIRQHCPSAFIAISASSFPSDFDGLQEQPIYERRLFNELRGQGAERIIYSDRGSARIESLGGGGGQPYPRIDYPLPTDWRFFRSSNQNGAQGYQEQARALVRSPIWNPMFRVWGTQMIERTVNGDPSAITNPQRSTATRINLHLQVQTFHDNPAEGEDTEDDWDD